MSREKNSVEIIEKRKFLRLDDYFRVSYRLTDEFGADDDAQALEVGYSKNLSLGGVAFVADSAPGLEIGAVLRATIQIPELDGPIEVVGEVVRLTELDTGGRVEVAVRFLPFGMDEEQRGKLELFIYEHFIDDPF